MGKYDIQVKCFTNYCTDHWQLMSMHIYMYKCTWNQYGIWWLGGKHGNGGDVGPMFCCSILCGMYLSVWYGV